MKKKIYNAKEKAAAKKLAPKEKVAKNTLNKASINIEVVVSNFILLNELTKDSVPL